MKNHKEHRKILKVRPFNMANFSGGSGYLVFSLIYQFFAVLPAIAIIWIASLVKLPKDKESNVIDIKRAEKRYYAVSIPICTAIIIIGTVMAFVCNYGTFAEYWIEVLFIALVPGISLFFILRFFHSILVNKANSDEGVDTKYIIIEIIFSIIATLVLFAIVFAASITMDGILSDIAYQKQYG